MSVEIFINELAYLDDKKIISAHKENKIITGIEIENYRGIKSLKLEELKRINLIAGVNNVGKSSILKTIHSMNLQYLNIMFLDDTNYMLDKEKFYFKNTADPINFENFKKELIVYENDFFKLNEKEYGMHIDDEADFINEYPRSLYGKGTRKIMDIIMCIVNNRNGIVLIDEIENGIHLYAMPKLWKAICELTIKYDCQLFFTTHSEEFKKSILEDKNNWEKHKDDFAFIYLNKYEDAIVPSTRSGDKFSYYMENTCGYKVINPPEYCPGRQNNFNDLIQGIL